MSDPRDVTPFLRSLASGAPAVRPLGAALTPLVRPEATSPWSPRVAVEEPAGQAISAEQLAALTEEARTRGRAEGLAETAALRARLAAVIEQLCAARAAIVPPAAEVIAEVCGCVIEGWLDVADRAALFAPIVTSWLAASSQPATARVHPDDLAALTQLVGDAPIAVVGDPKLAPGALAIRSAVLEVSQDWHARLPTLRTAIAAALTADGLPAAPPQAHTDAEPDVSAEPDATNGASE